MGFHINILTTQRKELLSVKMDYLNEPVNLIKDLNALDSMHGSGIALLVDVDSQFALNLLKYFEKHANARTKRQWRELLGIDPSDAEIIDNIETWSNAIARLKLALRTHKHLVVMVT